MEPERAWLGEHRAPGEAPSLRDAFTYDANHQGVARDADGNDVAGRFSGILYRTSGPVNAAPWTVATSTPRQGTFNFTHGMPARHVHLQWRHGTGPSR